MTVLFRGGLAPPNVGIEIENESRSIRRAQVQEMLNEFSRDALGHDFYGTPWELIDEGSLRAGPYGWELRTRNENQGMDYSRAVMALQTLYPMLVNGTGTWRAAVHIHVNAMSMVNRRRAIALALAYAFDDALFERHSPERRESNFCEPLAHKSTWVMDVIQGMALGLPYTPYGRYSSVNAESLDRWGTFEFRHMQTPGTGSDIASVGETLKRIRAFMDDCVVLLMGARDVRFDSDDQLAAATVVAAEWINKETRLAGWMNEDALAQAIEAMGRPSAVDYTRVDLGTIVEVTRR